MAFPIPPLMRSLRGSFPSRASHVTLPIPEWVVLSIFITGRPYPPPPPSRLRMFSDLLSLPEALVFSVIWAFTLSIIARSRAPSLMIWFPRASNYPSYLCPTLLISAMAHPQGTVQQLCDMPFVASILYLFPSLQPMVLATPHHAASPRVEEGSHTQSRQALEVVGINVQATTHLWYDNDIRCCC